MTLTLKQMLLNEIDNQPRGYAEELASFMSYSSGSALKKVLKDEKKEFEKFSSLVKAVHTLPLFKGRIKQTMTDYALTLDAKKQSARYFLEYCEISTFHELKEILIEKMLDCGNVTSEEWAKIYQTAWLFKQEKIGLGEAISRLSSINTKSLETKVAVEIYKSYCYLAKERYNMISDTLLPIENLIDEIKEPYIRNNFNGRYALFMIEHYIRNNELEKSRELSRKLIETNSNDLFVIWGYLHLGNSYIVESFDKSHEYLSKGIELCGSRYRNVNKQLKRSINFLCNVWKVDDPKYLDLTSDNSEDIHEIAFYYINKGQITEANKILNKVKIDEITLNSKGFHYYLLGLLTNNIDHFSESVGYFKRSGDYYYMSMPLLEMRKLGIPESVIKTLAL